MYVDDGSTDDSYAELVRLHDGALERSRRSPAPELRQGRGPERRLRPGARATSSSRSTPIFRTTPPRSRSLLAKLDEGYDLVSGWKCTRRDPFARRVFSRIYNGATAVVTGVHLHDMNCGLKAYRAEVLQNVRLYGEMHRFVPVLAHHLGFRTTEIAVNHRERAVGRSRYGLERYTRGFFDLLTVAYLGRYRHRPLHFFGGIGMLLGAVGSVILLYLTAIKIGGASIGGRPLLMLGIVLVVVGVQFFSLGLVGELLTSHHEERAADRGQARAQVRDTLL